MDFDGSFKDGFVIHRVVGLSNNTFNNLRFRMSPETTTTTTGAPEPWLSFCDVLKMTVCYYHLIIVMIIIIIIIVNLVVLRAKDDVRPERLS